MKTVKCCAGQWKRQMVLRICFDILMYCSCKHSGIGIACLYAYAERWEASLDGSLYYLTFLSTVNTRYLESAAWLHVLGSTELQNKSSFQHEQELMNGKAFVFILQIREPLE